MKHDYIFLFKIKKCIFNCGSRKIVITFFGPKLITLAPYNFLLLLDNWTKLMGKLE